MALRLRRDVQKASYYVWFLGAEEAKGLRGERVINSVLPYLIDRSRGQEPLKVTLQVSHKGIKILQGSSKHFIPHSAITSSVQTDDIVACVLLLYNPATKCPLHVHAYRCDSESTAETLHQQLQILINRPENQKRFEELETRLGILPPLPTSANKSTSATAHIGNKEPPHSQKQQQQHYQSQQKHQQQQRRHDTSPKRFNSSLGSDTGNSTRESECSEENSGSSPISRSPPIIKTAVPLPQPNNELFDSLAAELRAKLNGNGPPLLLPPRDYDTVHRSKGNLTAIELRRCRNALIVGGAKTPNGKLSANGKQVSSRGSSGIGSDLAPSPERQEINSSSDEEHWSNEADNSVIALKPSQIAMERSAPIIPHHPQLNRKSAVKTPEDSYLRDLPAKPYTPRPIGEQSSARDIKSNSVQDTRSKVPVSGSWSREDEIKPIIMRPSDYDAKFHRVLQLDDKKLNYNRVEREHPKLRDTDKYNEINRLLNKKLTIDANDQPDHHHHQRHNKHNKVNSEFDDYNGSDLPNEKLPVRATSSNGYVGKENLTDKQKFLEYNSKQKLYAAEEAQKYGGRHRYVDPADLPFDPPPPAAHSKYSAAAHHSERATNRSPNRSDRREFVEPERRRRASREREPDTERYGRSSERNPYREPESIPYIKSMEKMMKSTAMHYKSHGAVEDKDEGHAKIGQRSKSYPKHENDYKNERDYNGYAPRTVEYTPSLGSREGGNRYKEAKEKMRPLERSGSRHNLVEERDFDDHRPRRRGSVEPIDRRPHMYGREWSDEERLDEPPHAPIASRSRSRSRDQWEQDIDEILPPRQSLPKEPYARREYAREMCPRERSASKHSDHHIRDSREISPERYHEQRRYEPPRERERGERETHYRARDHSREYHRRNYSPDTRSGSDYRPDYPKVEKKQHHAPGAPIASAKSLSNLAKGYRHSYAEPVFARGRVGLAAVNPY